MLRSKRDESLREVLLDHHKDPTAIRGNAGWKGAMLVPFANRIKNGTYTLNGETHYLERNEDRGIYGKIAIHGYLYRKAMNVRPAVPRHTLPRCAALWGWWGRRAQSQRRRGQSQFQRAQSRCAEAEVRSGPMVQPSVCMPLGFVSGGCAVRGREGGDARAVV